VKSLFVKRLVSIDVSMCVLRAVQCATQDGAHYPHVTWG